MTFLYSVVQAMRSDGRDGVLAALAREAGEHELTPVERLSHRYDEPFTAQIRSAHASKAYLTAVNRFIDWCAPRPR